MKHKVGDVVRIKSREWYDMKKDKDGIVRMLPYVFNKDMVSYCGREAVIVGIKDNYYKVHVDDNRWK